MMRCRSAWPALALLLAAAPAVRADATDEAALREAKLGADAPSLLKYFQQRTLADTDKNKIAVLIKLLGDDLYSVRERASEEILGVGPVALGQLREATKDVDLEVVKRARRAIEEIEKTSNPNVARAAVRL